MCVHVCVHVYPELYIDSVMICMYGIDKAYVSFKIIWNFAYLGK